MILHISRQVQGPVDLQGLPGVDVQMHAVLHGQRPSLRHRYRYVDLQRVVRSITGSRLDHHILRLKEGVHLRRRHLHGQLCRGLVRLLRIGGNIRLLWRIRFPWRIWSIRRIWLFRRTRLLRCGRPIRFRGSSLAAAGAAARSAAGTARSAAMAVTSRRHRV